MHTQIWERVSNFMNIKLDGEPVYGDNDKYIKTKIRIYGNKVNIIFHSKKWPKENAPYKWLLIIMLVSVIRAKKSIILKHYWKNAKMK